MTATVRDRNVGFNGHGAPANGATTFAARALQDELQARIAGWNAALEMTRRHPWFGIGPGRYREVYPTVSDRGDPIHAYNILLHVAAEVGVIGVVCFGLMWFYALRGSLRLAVPTMPGAVSFAMHGALAAFLVRSQSEHFLANLSTSYRLLLLLGVLFGLVEAMRVWQRRIDD